MFKKVLEIKKIEIEILSSQYIFLQTEVFKKGHTIEKHKEIKSLTKSHDLISLKIICSTYFIFSANTFWTFLDACCHYCLYHFW